MLKISFILFITLSAFSADYYYEYGKKVELTKVLQSRSYRSSDVTEYLTSKGHKIGIKNEIIAKCNLGLECEKLFLKYNLTSVSKLSNTLYLIKIIDVKDIFKISQQLHKDKNIVFAQPNLVKKKYRR